MMTDPVRACRMALLAGLVLTAPVCLSDEAAEAGGNGDKEVEVKGATLGRMGEPIAASPDEYQFAEAEFKLWLDDHLQNIEYPGRLYYDFVKRGSYEEGFSDSVYLDIVRLNDDGSKDTRMEFFTAERKQDVSADNLKGITGNPVMVVYMQGDVYEMNRLTNGSWRYFQRRIKSAFSSDATIEPVTFEFDGAELAGEKISITPYLDDPRRRQFAEFATKVYEFILSDQVPGKLYQIRTIIPGNSPDTEPLIEEKLTLQHAEFEKL